MKLSDTDLAALNKWLADIYGRRVDDGQPNFRVVWSEDQYEKRRGEFAHYIDDLFLYRKKEVVEVKKYPYILCRYVLERYQVNTHPEEIVGVNFSYEPLWCIMDKNGNYLPPKREALAYFLDYLLFEKKPRLTQSDFDEQERKEIEAEQKAFHEYLDNEVPALPAAIKRGEAAFIPGGEHGDSN